MGGYGDWETRGGLLSDAEAGKATKPAIEKPANTTEPTVKSKTKLSYKLQRELASLPGLIEKLEKQKSEIEQTMSAAGFYESDHEQVQLFSDKLLGLEKELEVAFKRWDELDNT